MNSYNGFLPAQRNRALRWIKAEYAAGRRQRHTVCQGCGQDRGVIGGHSEDYSEPFGDHIGAYGLCYTCHMMVHNRFQHPGAWDRYRAAVRKGLMFEPFRTRNFGKFCALFLGPEIRANASMRLFPCPLVLDEIAARPVPDQAAPLYGDGE